MRHRLRAGLIFVIGLSSACGGNDAPAGPTTIHFEGRLISARSRVGIPDATVHIGALGGDEFVTTTTDPEGNFAATVNYNACEGVVINIDHPGYLPVSPFPDVCPGSSRTIELDPRPTMSLITPHDPSIGLGGVVAFHVAVTFFDGTVDDDGEAAWGVVARAELLDTSVCGTIPDPGPVRGTTYIAPAVPLPPDCGVVAGQTAVVAVPVVRASYAIEASDTVVVTVTP